MDAKHTTTVNANNSPFYLVACSARASGPVDVVLIVVGAVVVDHQNQLLDVQTSGRHRGGHHQATSSVLEIVDDAVSVVLINSWKKRAFQRENISSRITGCKTCFLAQATTPEFHHLRI